MVSQGKSGPEPERQEERKHEGALITARQNAFLEIWVWGGGRGLLEKVIDAISECARRRD